MSTFTSHYRQSLKKYTHDRNMHGAYSKKMHNILKNAKKNTMLIATLILLLTIYQTPALNHNFSANPLPMLVYFFVNCAGVGVAMHTTCMTILLKAVHAINTNTTHTYSQKAIKRYTLLGRTGHTSAMISVICFFGLLTYTSYKAHAWLIFSCLVFIFSFLLFWLYVLQAAYAGEYTALKKYIQTNTYI